MKGAAILTVIFFALLSNGQSDVNDAFNQNAQAEATSKTREETITWTQLTFLFALINQQSMTTIDAISQLYASNETQTVSGLLLNPNCTIFSESEYVANKTNVWVSICCELQRVTFPAMTKMIAQAYTFYHGVAIDVDQAALSQQIVNINQTMNQDILGFKAIACSQDKTIVIPDQSCVRAQGIFPIVSQIYKALQQLKILANQLVGCINNPTTLTGCVNNSTLTLGVVAPNLQYFQYDPVFYATCSQSALINFNSLQYTLGCGPFYL